MRHTRTILLIVVAAAAALGYWLYVPSDGGAEDDVYVKVSSSDETLCNVKDRRTGSDRNIPCSELAGYLQRQLNLPTGTRIPIMVSSEMAAERISRQLKKTGYSVAVLRAGFITEPSERH